MLGRVRVAGAAQILLASVRTESTTDGSPPDLPVDLRGKTRWNRACWNMADRHGVCQRMSRSRLIRCIRSAGSRWLKSSSSGSRTATPARAARGSISSSPMSFLSAFGGGFGTGTSPRSSGSAKGTTSFLELASLFEDTGPRAVKVRLDYSDVMVALSEENYFRPLYEWHHSRGMLYGCDHGGRGRDVTEFGDYFRTQRWMTGPGNDQPGLASDVIKNKVSSSITHLYQRERTWLEGYYGSGWGTTSADLVDATWRNFAQGQNLLTLHGLYYSTHGGWWEWAPPCNHFRMPYWAHMPEFLHAVERMSYLLSQGHHRADVAIVYPVASMEAGLNGKEAVDAAFALGTYLYEHGIDFDFVDFESLARARVEDRKLKVADEEYRALVLPAMRAVRHSTLEKAVELQRAGGVSIVLGAAPQASERTGNGDPEVLAMARELSPAAVRSNAEVASKITGRDFACKAEAQPSVLHRKVGTRDIYMVYGATRDTECTFRAGGPS